MKESVRDCVRAFGESGVALLSNSAGLLQYDPSGAEADAIEKKLGLSVLRHRRKKPAKEPGLLEAHFGAEAHELVMVGDRTFTDVAFGNAMGMLTIKCAPFTSKGENFLVKMVSKLAKPLSIPLGPPPRTRLRLATLADSALSFLSCS